MRVLSNNDVSMVIFVLTATNKRRQILSSTGSRTITAYVATVLLATVVAALTLTPPEKKGKGCDTV